MEYIATVLNSIGEVREACTDPESDFSGPVSEDEILAAEAALGIRFPASYRAFLLWFGAGDVHYYDIFGLPRDHLWGDVVRMNHTERRVLPQHYLRFTDDVGDYSYYLDTSRMNASRECPVVLFGGGEEGTVVADSFLDFLRMAREGNI